MQGKPLEATRKSLCIALSELDPDDFFNIIAFNGEIFSFSSTMKRATQELIEKATRWTDDTLVVGGGTKISLALDMVCLLSQKCVKEIYLLTILISVTFS